MLNQLMALLETRGTWRVTELAAVLGTSTNLVNAMLSHLAQSGKLAQADQGCTEACAGCSLKASCQIGSSGRTFFYARDALERPGDQKTR
ncbi:MAG: hypothetical protein JXB30_11470 [Anaerolineae bacterium]|nr:hypothetical protein [Anaerolineae bacterium]